MDNEKDEVFEYNDESCGGCGCGCDHSEDDDIEDLDSEDDIMYLTLDDDTELECKVLGIFEVEDSEYIALLPLDEESYGDDEDVALVFRIDSDENGDILVPLEDEEEYQIVVDVYNTLMDEEGLNDNEF